MPPLTTSWQFHELIPVVGLLIAAVPELLQVVEHRHSLMVPTGLLMVLLLQVILPASLVDASQFALFRLEHLLVFVVFLCLLFLFLLLEFLNY